MEPPENYIMLLSDFGNIAKYIDSNKVTASDFAKIIVNKNLRWEQIIYIYDKIKKTGFFADSLCFQRLLDFDKINFLYEILFIDFIIDLISLEIDNLAWIAKMIFQHKTNKINLLIKAMKELYIGIPINIFHRIIKYEYNYDPNDFILLLYNRLNQNITIETLTLLYKNGHFGTMEYIIPCQKQLINLYFIIS